MLKPIIVIYFALFVNFGFALPTRNRQLDTAIELDQLSSKEEWPSMDIPKVSKEELPYPSSTLGAVIEYIDKNFAKTNEVDSNFMNGSNPRHFDEEARQLLYSFLSKMTP